MKCGHGSEADRDLVVSFITPVEITSAIWRRTDLGRNDRVSAERQRAQLELAWSVFERYGEILALAHRAIMRHSLRTGDAIQLASALLFCGGETAQLPFVTLDDELRRAAASEGFPTLP